MKPTSQLVQNEGSVVSRALFGNDEIFRQEIDRIFSRAWLFVGHECLVPNAGDYFVSRMGLDSVILSRSATGSLHVFLNSCTHRGMRLCRQEFGNSRSFTCPYHAWSFTCVGTPDAPPGALTGVPGLKTHYKDELDRSQLALKSVAKLANYKGTVWATWDADAPEFEDYLGDMRLYLDAALDHRDGRPGGSELIGGIQKWRVPCNWKLPAENFIGDLYHDVSHRSVDSVGIGPSSGRGRRDQMPGRVAITFPELGHGLLGNVPYFAEPEYSAPYQDHPEVQDYYRSVYEQRVANLGDRQRVFLRVGTIFPNMSVHGWQPRTITVYHPVSATEMEMWRMYLVDADAPEPVKEAARHYYLRYSGPGGMTESDDMENWSSVTQGSVGSVAQEQVFSYHMGQGHAQPAEHLNEALVSFEYSEESARAYYRRWAQFMSASSWREISSEISSKE